MGLKLPHSEWHELLDIVVWTHPDDGTQFEVRLIAVRPVIVDIDHSTFHGKARSWELEIWSPDELKPDVALKTDNETEARTLFADAERAVAVAYAMLALDHGEANVL